MVLQYIYTFFTLIINLIPNLKTAIVAMELRNGSIYTPELNKHYYYSLSLSRKRSPKRPKGHSLSRSADRESARSAHSFNFEINDSGGGEVSDGESLKSLLKYKQEDKNQKLSTRSKNTVILDDQSIQEVPFKGDIFGLKSKDKAMKEAVISAEEITEIRTSTTNYLSFSQRENLFLKEVHKTSTPVQHRIHQNTHISYDNSEQTSNGNQKQKRQRISWKKQVITNEEEDVFANTLEDHIFHDTSYKRVTSFDDEQTAESNFCDDESFHYLYKLNGTSLLNYSDVSDDEEIDVDSSFVNHYKRGLSRQKRRDWYLNRRNFSGKYVSKFSTFQYWIILIKTIIFSIIRKTTNLFRSSGTRFSRVRDFFNDRTSSYFYSSYFWIFATNIYALVKTKSYSVLTWLLISTQSFMHTSTNFFTISLFKRIFNGSINFIQILKTTLQRIFINR